MNSKIELSIITMLLLSTNLIAQERLEDITVTTATKATQKLEEVTSNIAVITTQEIEERHYTTVTEALNSLVGVSFTNSGGLGQPTSLYLRGMASARVLVLIDGIRYNDVTGLTGAPFEHLMISDIEQIELIKGANSGIWGADASAGVINIITKKAKKGLHFGVSQEFGSFETSKSNADISYKNSNFYIKATYSDTNSKGFSAVAPKGQDLDKLEDDGYSNKTSSIKAGLNINSKNSIDISHTIIEAKTEADAYDNVTYSFNPNSRYNSKTKDKFSKINYHHVDNFNRLNIFAKKSEFSRYYPDASFSKNFDGVVDEYGLTSKIGYKENDFILIGGEYKKFEHKNSIDKKYNNRAFFITNSNSVNMLDGKTIFTQSLRQDNYDKFENKLTGKVGLKYLHSKGFLAGANWGTAYNIPTHYNLFDPYAGNSKLTPEESVGYDLTVGYKSFKATYFNSSVDDMIEYQSQFDVSGNWIGGKYQNIKGKSELKGFELSYQQDILDSTIITLGYTTLDAKDRDGNILARRAKESLKFTLDYYGIENLYLGLNGEYVGERYEQKDKQGTQTGKYTIANFNANYQIDNSFSLYGKVVNLTDKKYQRVDGYATSPRAFYGGVKFRY